jgi:hypothetical protein
MQSNSNKANKASIDVVIHGALPYMASHVAALARPLLDTDDFLASETAVEAYWTVTGQYANKW